MSGEDVRRILQNLYDVSASTLDWGPSPNAEYTTYFYTLDRRYTDEIETVRTDLEKQLSKESAGRAYEIKKRWPKKKRYLPQCASLDETLEGWTLTFHYITGVRYHRSYGKHVTATLLITNTPFITLSSEKNESFYGYWDSTDYYRAGRKAGQPVSNGMNYRINRNLACNEQFRKFTVEFFFAEADMVNTHILKDIGRVIRDYGFFLPSISFSDVVCSHTPQELIRNSVPLPEKLNMNFNRTDLNKAWVIVSLFHIINENDRDTLLNITPDIIVKCLSIKGIFSGFTGNKSIEEFIVNYYMHVRGITETYEEGVQHYVHMCLIARKTIRLTYSFEELMKSLFHLLAAHTTLGDAVLTASPSKFDKLEKSLDMICPNEFRRIHTTGQLVEEHLSQHNCVLFRIDLIENDEAAVFHWSFEKESCTVQFSVDCGGNYCVDEIKARFNTDISESAASKIADILIIVNIFRFAPCEGEYGCPL